MQSIFLFLRGLLMGAADVVPGISGGTIALITGIYPKLIKALSQIDLRFFSLLLKGKFKQSFQIIKKIQFSFFIPLGFGILLAIYLFSGVIETLLTSHTGQIYSFFIGLILASTIFLYKKTKIFKFESFIFLVFGALFAYLISDLTMNLSNHSLPVIFISGVIAISAMILPGISGAFLLLLLGQYEYLISVIHEVNLVVIATFGIGAVIGLLSFSKLIHHILKKYYNLTISFLIGLMFGSLRVPLQKITQISVGTITFWLIIGFMMVMVLESLFKNNT